MVDAAAAMVAREHLVQRIRALESRPEMTKTSIKAAIFGDRTIDWRSMRQDVARNAEGRRPPNWKSDLVSQLLLRRFPHGGARARRHGAAAPRPLTHDPLSVVVDTVPSSSTSRNDITTESILDVARIQPLFSKKKKERLCPVPQSSVCWCC